jgi:uracil-DNA glycosylase
MVSGELKRSVKEYRKIWEEAGVELSPAWQRAVARVTAPGQARPTEFPAPAVSPPAAESRPALDSLEQVRAWLGECTRCKLCSARTHIVFGSGNPKADLLFIGEGPGADEDASGQPFIGAAGELLTKIIEAMGYNREKDTYIANLVKCRPPGNRTPEPDEIASCLPFLKEQIRLVEPKVVVALGSSAAATLLGTDVRITSARGKFQPLPWAPGIAVMPTFHPAYLLRNPVAKKSVWDDMKLVVQKLGGKAR